jgi:peptidoglycan/xylan/chitin deacetylase (PgdA/CDA1 family)
LSKEFSTREARGWPAGKSLALFVNVMVEGWSEDSAPHNSASSTVKPGYIDTRGQSWAEYGPRSGAPRLLKVLSAHGIKATFFTNGVIAERYPELVARIAEEGHSVQCHGYYQNLPPLYLEGPQEQETIARSREILSRTTGITPDGWLSPRVTPSLRTPGLLAKAGFRWYADVCDSDLPYRQDTANGPIIAMPFDNDVNDQRIHLAIGAPAHAFTDTFKRALETWYSRHNDPACLNITAHAHVFGRPYGAGEFENAIEIALHTPYAFITTQDALSKNYA